MQGLVQISVGCYHFIGGNFKGACSQLIKGKIKLKNYLPSFKDIDVKSLLNDIELLLSDIENFSSK